MGVDSEDKRWVRISDIDLDTRADSRWEQEKGKIQMQTGDALLFAPQFFHEVTAVVKLIEGLFREHLVIVANKPFGGEEPDSSDSALNQMAKEFRMHKARDVLRLWKAETFKKQMLNRRAQNAISRWRAKTASGVKSRRAARNFEKLVRGLNAMQRPPLVG